MSESNTDGAGDRPISPASAVTSDWDGDDFQSARERQSVMTGVRSENSRPPSSSAAGSVQQQRETGRKGMLGKTHVPGVASSAFFRPMSSSKLQAQRKQRPMSALEEGAGGSGGTSAIMEEKGHVRRYSNASVNTLRDQTSPPKTADKDAPPMPHFPADISTSTQQEDNAASVSSATPLQLRANNAANLEVEQADRSPRSPRSLRASLGLGSRTSRQEREGRPSPSAQHEKLHSHPSSPQYTEEKKPPPTPSKNASTDGKNYEYFAGNMLFFLSGRCMNTKAKPLNVATCLLTVLPAALFFAFSAPWLWHHVSPALPIVFAYVFYVALSAFLHGTLSDPGILPRNMHPHPPIAEEERDPLTVGPPTTEWIMVKTFPSSTRSPLPGRANNSSGEDGSTSGQTTAMEVPTKYCKSCNIWRPLRAHHCRVCDACIETQDHHCVWLNNCIGRRNYRYFFSYVSWASLLALLLLAFSIIHIQLYAQNNNTTFGNALAGRTQERIAFALLIYSIFALPYPGSLFAYHLFLVARGETTREYLNSHKFLPKDRHRPFTQASWLRNWISVLTRPRPPTYLQFKRAHVPGDVRFGHEQPRSRRQKALQNRYSVQSAANGNGNGAAGGVEMKQLNPPVPKDEGGTTGKPVGLGLSGPLNRTPR